MVAVSNAPLQATALELQILTQTPPDFLFGY